MLVPSDYPNTVAFNGLPPLFSEKAFIYDFFVFGRAAKNVLFIQVNIGKAFSDGLSGVPAFLPERFPPLPVLARSWDEDKILHEIGKPTDPSLGGNFSEHRDLILVTELARRGLSETSFIKLLLTVPSRELASRASTVFRAMHEAGKDSDVDRYFEPMLAAYQRLGSSANGAVEEAFRVLSGRKACAREFEQSAFTLLQAGTIQEMALHYLGECSNSEEAAHMLESISVPSQLAPMKESTLLRIQSRVAQQQ